MTQMRKRARRWRLAALLAGASVLGLTSLAVLGFEMAYGGPSPVRDSSVARHSQGQKALMSGWASALLPSIGQPKLLVIPVEIPGYSDPSVGGFPDSQEIPANWANMGGVEAHADWPDLIRKAFFGRSEETGWESVASFYRKSSYGKLDIQGTVAPVFRSRKSFGQLKADAEGKNVPAVSFKEETDGILEDAYQAYFDGPNAIYDLSDFDSDGDGCVDAVAMVYDLPNSNMAGYGSWGTWMFWAYKSGYDRGTRGYSVPSEDHVSSYIWLSKWNLVQGALTANRPYQDAGGNALADAHTPIHETGHLLGLPDRYDTSGNSRRSPTGSLETMDNGVFDHDPWSKWFLGWIDPRHVSSADVAESDFRLSLRPFEESGDALVVDLPGNKGWIGEQYYILSYWTPTGLNARDAEGSADARKFRKEGLPNRHEGYRRPGIQAYKADGRFAPLAYSKSTPFFTVASMSEFEAAGDGSDWRQWDFLMDNSSEKGKTDSDDAAIELMDARREFPWMQADGNWVPDDAVAATDDAFFRAGDVLDDSFLGRTKGGNFVFSFHGADGSPDPSLKPGLKLSFGVQDAGTAEISVSAEEKKQAQTL